MSLSETPVPEGVQRHISLGRYREAAKALTTLTARRPSAPHLLALASVNLQLGDLPAARDNALTVVEADPRRHGARFMLARIRAALDERDAALADFRAAFDLYFEEIAGKAAGPIPAHLALHNLEQLAYIEQAKGLPAGTLLPATEARREEIRRQLTDTLDKAGVVVPGVVIDGEVGRALAHPPRVMHEEPPPEKCLGERNDWAATVQSFADNGGMACVDNFLTPAALAQIQRFCLLSTAWRQSNRHGYVGGLAEHGFFSMQLLQLAAELKQAVPELLSEHHLIYWWGFVYQHQRPGTDIHADQSDISLNFWVTPDSANLEPGTGGLDLWNVEAPSNWTFGEYNAGDHRIRMYLKQAGAKQLSFAYGENRALLFKGSLFHQTAASRFADGFENRRRNITMLFKRTRPA